MPKLLLKFHAAVIKEIPIEKTPLTIGRKSDNDVIIDNMAVSGRHARVILQGNTYVIEDLQSTNGTMLNDKRIINAGLKHEDQIVIGQHTIVFVHPEAAEPEPAAPHKEKIVDSEATVVLTPGAARPGAAPETAAVPQAAESNGMLRVIDGKSDQPEYRLTSLLTYIGKSSTAAIRIKGLFAPDIAALISKRPAGYIITAVKEGYPKLNGKAVSGQMELKEGDIIEAGGTRFLFQFAKNG